MNGKPALFDINRSACALTANGKIVGRQDMNQFDHQTIEDDNVICSASHCHLLTDQSSH
ncbi:MAG: hypothetical protein VYB37_02355 [Pseudomonadota bacterium]|nr:hypothetical protein [Pseudomonadota bacterium]